MTGIIIVTHDNFGKSLAFACENIIGKQDNVWCLDSSKDNVEEEIKKIMNENKLFNGFIIFVDIFGGTPCNVALKFAKIKNIEIICGINLPMLISSFSHRKSGVSIKELTGNILNDGKKGILSAKEKFLQRLKATK